MKNLLTVSDLTISYDGAAPSLRGVDVCLGRKEILGIVGESGSGKTTLIRSLINLLPANTSVRSQTMHFNGKELGTLSKEQWRRIRGSEIAMVFQNPGSYLNPTIKIGRQFVESIRNKQPLSKKEAKQKALLTLAKMHLDDPRRVMNAYPFQLSGGMQQRVAIAMTIVMEPLLILADEPTSALDVKTQAQIVRELVALRETFDTSIIMVTHNICCSAHTADRLMVMRKGKVVECDQTTRVLKNPQQAYTRQLLGAIPILKGVKSSSLLGEMPKGGDNDIRGSGQIKSQNLSEPSASANPRAAENTHIPERSEKTGKSGEPPVLQVKAVDKIFEGDRGKKVEALKRVSFSLYKGECLGIVGESGSGKSTLARVVSRLTDVNRGTISLQGKDISAMRGAALKSYYQRVQMIFQDPLGAFSPRMKIGEYMVEPFLNFRIMSKKKALTYAQELLDRVDLSPSMVTRYPSELSGGQLQRVVIARCVGLKPEIIICDECTSALDVTIQEQIIHLFQKLRDNSGFASLLITHDLALAETICDRILVMYKGEVVERLTGENIVCEAIHPYTVELIRSVFCLPDYVHPCCKNKQFSKHSRFCTKGQCLRRNKRDMMLNECSMQ